MAIYLVPNSPAFDRAAIFDAAHMSAHLYHRSSGGYRSAFREGLKAAWKQAAIKRTAFVLRGRTREDSPKVTAIRRQIFMLQMRDRLTERDYSEISHLKDEVAALEQAA